MNTTKKLIRHGDMFIVRVSENLTKKSDANGNLTNESKPSISKSSLTVGIGEVSGHSHLIRPIGKNTEIIEYANSVEELTKEDIYKDQDETIFEIRNGNAVITHEEHGPIILEPGVYKRWFQVAYDPFAKELLKVRD